MIRYILAALLLIIPIWAPWMDSWSSEEITQKVFGAFGPMPSVCYDDDEQALQEGLSVRWYPLGRFVHTCTGDCIVWFWGAVKEAGGVYKKSSDLQTVQSRPLTCTEVLKRQDLRRASSTITTVLAWNGEKATEPDFSLFPEAEGYRTLILQALKGGPTFAGKFTVAEWGCGTLCQNHAIIDVESGRVVALGPSTEYGIQYALDSTLLVTNPKENLPDLPQTQYETESLALSVAKTPREYYRLTNDVLSDTQYLVRECIESSATGYIDVEDNRLGVTKYDD